MKKIIIEHLDQIQESLYIEGRQQGLKEAQRYATELQGCTMRTLFEDLKNTSVEEYLESLHD